MGKLTGFIDYPRQSVPYRAPLQRIHDFDELFTEPNEAHLRIQGARCMDCGVPFCQSASGCPIDNLIPEWNELVVQGRWREALDRLHQTNNFPEFTGRTCPAPCESACVLSLIEPAVTIKNIENAIIDRGFAEGWVQPRPPAARTGHKIAIIGSGPAGLAAADQLNGVGHQVTVYERADRLGGLLMYGIPNMKLDKQVVERRIQLLRDEGVQFVTCAQVGPCADVPTGHSNQIMQQAGHQLQYLDIDQLRAENDALLLATGATQPFDPTLDCPGRSLSGIYFAMDFLTRDIKSLLDSGHKDRAYLSARDRQVIVIGGGDTGADCIGTALRHGCKSLVNFVLLDRPPEQRAADNPWPEWPQIYRVEYAHEEAAARFGADPRVFSILAKQFIDNGRGQVAAVRTVAIDRSRPTVNGPPWTEIVGSEHTWSADLVLLAAGYEGPELGLARKLGLTLQKLRWNRHSFAARHGDFATNIPGVFAAGDCRRGQSLVVWAINEGRGAAKAIDLFLRGC